MDNERWLLLIEIEYAAYYRMHDKLAGLLVGKDVSEMEWPQIPMLCATLSSIINNRETEHFHKAVGILWELHEVVLDMVSFESFGNLLIDILTFKILVEMTEFDSNDYEQLVNDILGSFRIPGEIKLSHEDRKWLGKKYEAISKKLIVIIHNESRDLCLSYFNNLITCNCFWDNIKGRVDVYLDKVNEKFGPPILEVLLRHGKPRGEEKSQDELADTEPSSSSTGRNLNAFRSKEIHAETVSSDCREGTAVIHTGDLNTDAGISSVGGFGRPENDEEHKPDILSQTKCPCGYSGAENKKQESESASRDFVKAFNDGSRKEINKLSNNKVRMDEYDEESDQSSLLSECFDIVKQTDGADKEMGNFNHGENGDVSSVEETECAMFSKDKSKQDDKHTFQESESASQDVVKAVNDGSCKEINQLSDNEARMEDYDEKSDEESDQSSILSECFDIVKQTDGADKEMVNFNHGENGDVSSVEETECAMFSNDKSKQDDKHTFQESESASQDVVKAVNGGSCKEILNQLSDNEARMEDYDEESNCSMLSECFDVVKQTDVNKDLDNFNHGENGSLSGVEETDCSMFIEDGESNQEDEPKFPVITDISSAINQADSMSKSCDSITLFDSNDTDNGDKEEVGTDTFTTNKQSDSRESGSKPLPVDSNARSNNQGHGINKEEVKKDRNPSTDSHEGPVSIDASSRNDVNGADAKNTATDYMDRQNISQSSTSTETDIEAVSIKEVIDYLVDVINESSDESENTQDPASFEAVNNDAIGVNSSLSDSNVDDTSFPRNDAINEGLIKCPSIEIDKNQLNNDLNINGKNSAIKEDVLGSEKGRLAGDILMGIMQTQANKGNLIAKKITCVTATTTSQTRVPPPVSGICSMHIDKAQNKLIGIVNARRKVDNIDTPVTNQRSSNDDVNSSDNVNNPDDTTNLPTGASNPLQKVGNLPDSVNQPSSNDLVNQINGPFSKDINYPRRVNNAQNKVVATVNPLAKITDVRSLADNPTRTSCLNDEQTRPVTNTSIVQKTDRPDTELPSTNEQAPSIENGPSPLSRRNDIMVIGHVHSAAINPESNNGINDGLPLGSALSPSTTTLHISGIANPSQINCQYTTINNQVILLLVLSLRNSNSQASVCNQNGMTNQSSTNVCVNPTSVSQSIVSYAATNAFSPGHTNQPDIRINKDQPESNVETSNDQRNGRHFIENQERIKTVSSSGEEGTKKELPASKVSANKNQLGGVSDRCEHSITNNQENDGSTSVAYRPVNTQVGSVSENPLDPSDNESFTENLETIVRNISHDHSYSDNTSSAPEEVLEKSIAHDHCYFADGANNLALSRKRSSTSRVSLRLSRKPKILLRKQPFRSARVATTEQQKEVLGKSILNIAKGANNLALSWKRSSTPNVPLLRLKRRKTSLRKQPISPRVATTEQQNVWELQNCPDWRSHANRNTQPTSARLETDEEQNLGSLPNSSHNQIKSQLVSALQNKASQQGVSNSTSNGNILSENKGLNPSARSDEEGPSENDAGVSKTPVIKADNTKPKTSFTRVLPRNASSPSQAPQSGESLTVLDPPNAPSEDDRSSVRSPSIFDFLRPNSLTQDGDTCLSLEKNRWSSTDDSSEESRKNFNAVDETNTSDYTRDFVAFIEKKNAKQPTQIIDEPTRYKDCSEIFCNEPTKCTDVTGNSKALTLKKDAEFDLKSSMELSEKPRNSPTTSGQTKYTYQLTSHEHTNKYEDLNETREHLSKSSSLGKKISYKRKSSDCQLFDLFIPPGLLSNAPGIHSNKRSRVQPTSSQDTNPFPGSSSEVRTPEVPMSKVQNAKIRNSEVQAPEPRDAVLSNFEDQTSEASNLDASESSEASNFGASETSGVSKFESDETYKASNFEASESSEASNFEAGETSGVSKFESDETYKASNFEASESSETSDFEASETSETSDFESGETSEISNVEGSKASEESEWGTTSEASKSYESSSSESSESQVRKKKSKYEDTSIYTRVMEQQRIIKISPAREGRCKRKKSFKETSSLSKYEIPLRERKFPRNISKKSNSSKRQRLMESTIASTSGTILENEKKTVEKVVHLKRKCNLDAVVKLVKLKVEPLL